MATQSSRENVKFALLAINSRVQPEEQEDYEHFCTALRTSLAPADAVEEFAAAEFIGYAWRLRRCAFAEGTLGAQVASFQASQNKINNTDYPVADPMLYPEYLPTQNAIDRVRTSAHIAMCRAKAHLDKMQAARRKAQRSAVLQFEPKSAPAAEPVIPRPQLPLSATAEGSKGRLIAMPSIRRRNRR